MHTNIHKIISRCLLAALLASASNGVHAEEPSGYVDAPESLKMTCRSGHWKKTKSAERVMRKKLKLNFEKPDKIIRRLNKNKMTDLVQLDDDPFAGVKLFSVRGTPCTDKGMGSKAFMALAAGLAGDSNSMTAAAQVFSEGSYLEAHRDIQNPESEWVYRLVRAEWSGGEKTYDAARDLAGNRYFIEGLDKSVISNISMQTRGYTSCYSNSCLSAAHTDVRENTVNVANAGILLPRSLLDQAAAEGNRGFAFRLYGGGASKLDVFVLPAAYTRAFLRVVDDLDRHIVPRLLEQ